MLELRAPDRGPSQSWQRRILQDFENRLLGRPWARDLLLRGSLAKGRGDSQSDIDLVVTVAETDFAAAIEDLSATLPLTLSGGLPPWRDELVRDFGGIGFVYLLDVGAQKWGQVDIYLLPCSRKARLFELESAVQLATGSIAGAPDAAALAGLDSLRQRDATRAAGDLANAVLACYVALFLLRKRIIRQDAVQIFADTYLTAQCLRDLVRLVCSPGGSEHGWRDLAKIAARSPHSDLLGRVIATFTRQDAHDMAGFAARITGLEQLVSVLVPALWRVHGAALLDLGRYLRAGA